MNTTVRWQEQGPTRVVVSQPGPGFARLFGLPFVAAGGWFLYYLIGGLLHPFEMTIFGWILLPLMTAAFLLPGWLLMTLRKRVVLDTGAREVVDELDFLICTRRTTTRFPSDAHVMLRYERGSERPVRGPVTTHSSTSFWTHVYLVAGGKKVLLALFDAGEKTEPLAFAERAAAFLGLDVQDRRVEQGEIAPGGGVVERLSADEAD